MSALAPIGVTVYTRLEHVKQLIQALQKNTLARESRLYIFSDGAKAGDEEKVAAMRHYLHTLSGFESVTIIERDTNDRIKNNRGGLNFLLSKYGKVIWMAEDIVSAPGFLRFMNDALVRYEHREDILAISSYTPDIELNVQTDVYLAQRFNAWGYGIWKEKFDRIKPIDAADFERLMQDEQKVDYIKRYCGEDLLEWFSYEIAKRVDGLDTKASFLEVQDSIYSLYPKQSLTRNIGHDGSGLHCGVTDRYAVKLWDKTENFEMDLAVEKDLTVSELLASFYSSKENSIKQEVIENIVRQVLQENKKEVNIWGTSLLAKMLFEEFGRHAIEVKYFLDTWCSEHAYFCTKKVVTPAEALAKGASVFVIASISSRHAMSHEIHAMAKNPINVILYNE